MEKTSQKRNQKTKIERDVMKIVDKEDIPEDAVEMHLYDWQNVMMPRGSRQKESIYEIIFPRLVESFLSFTDPKYGDNPHIEDLLKTMSKNLLGEMLNAWEDFLNNPTVEERMYEIKKRKEI